MADKYTFYLSKKYKGDFTATTNILRKELNTYKDAIKKRPQKTHLPLFLAELGNVTFDFLIDFDSFRDVQRHRNGVCRMPLLTTKYGFNEWYIASFPQIWQRKPGFLSKSRKNR